MNNYMILFLMALATVGAYTIYKPFLLSAVIAILLYMATYNISVKLHGYFSKRVVSASIITTFLFLSILAPMVYFVTVGIEYLSSLDVDGMLHAADNIRIYLKSIPYIGPTIDSNINVDKLVMGLKESSGYLTNFGQAGIEFFKNTLFILVFYFFLNYYGDKIFKLLSYLLPMSKKDSEKMINDISATMEVVFYSTIATAIFEGIIFGIIAAFFGLNGILFGIMYGFASLIPIVGGAIVWIPITLYMWAHGDHYGAIVFATLSIVIVSFIADTLLKPIIIRVIKEDFLKSNVEINELVIFFAILAGMTSFGFWGVILGPAITAFFIAMMKLYIDQSRNGD